MIDVERIFLFLRGCCIAVLLLYSFVVTLNKYFPWLSAIDPLLTLMMFKGALLVNCCITTFQNYLLWVMRQS